MNTTAVWTVQQWARKSEQYLDKAARAETAGDAELARVYLHRAELADRAARKDAA